MAPVCVAVRLPLSVLFVFVLSFVLENVNSLLAYDRQALLDIRFASQNLIRFPRHRTFPLPPLLATIPAHLYTTPLRRRRRHKTRSRGKRRSGRLVRLKAAVVHSSASALVGNGSIYPYLVSPRSLEPTGTWLVSVTGADLDFPTRPCAPHLRRRGVNHRCLRPLARISGTDQRLAAPPPARVALVNARSLANKTFILNDFFITRQLDFLSITETWEKAGESSSFSELLPPGCSYFSAPRTTGRGGGIATVFKEDFDCKQLLPVSFSSFELIMFELGRSPPVLCAVIYRPPKYNKHFISDFSDFLAEIMPKYDHVLILGDMNIHVCCPSKPPASEFLSLIGSFDLVQSVTGPTQEHGHTLDLVLSFGLPVFNIEICGAFFSDHMPVLFNVSLPCHPDKQTAPALRRRMLNPSTAARFSSAFTNATVGSPSLASPVSTDELTSHFDSICLQVLDTLAPFKTRCAKPKTEPWLNDSTRMARKECRRAERQWKKDKLQVSFDILRDSWCSYQRIVKVEKTKHISGIIVANCHKPQVLFKTINDILDTPQFVRLDVSPERCELFLQFFIDKVANIRASIPTQTNDPSTAVACSAFLSHFEPVSLTQLEEIISQMKPTGSPLDVLPPRLAKETREATRPELLLIMNQCLAGDVPAVFKHAVVQPLLKKPNLDASVLCNFRPISKLPFYSKVMEKIALAQLMTHLKTHGILEVFQSGYRALHSTETALLKIFNDIFLATDSGDSLILVLLDLTAAFDTVDHDILISRLEQCVGIGGSALEFFKSYLSRRSFCVTLGDATSSTASLRCGVPQGSILGPILFMLYLLPLGSIFRKHGVSFHCYADDSQIYLPLKRNNLDSLKPLLACLEDVKAWLASSFLNFNDSKTEVMVFGPSNGHVFPPGDLGPLEPFLKPTATNLGFKIDSDLKMDKQINNVVRKSFFQLRRLSKVKSCLSRSVFETVMHAFMTSILDYCNSLYIGVNQASISRLQLVQNAAARLLTRTRKRDHISPVLASLHWLPVRFRIDFKILLLVFKCQNGLAPMYLCDLLEPYVPSRTLRSSDQLLLAVPKTRLKLRGNRAFSVAAPKLWNKLPLSVRQAPSLQVFKTRLKTHFYTLAFPSAV